MFLFHLSDSCFRSLISIVFLLAFFSLSGQTSAPCGNELVEGGENAPPPSISCFLSNNMDEEAIATYQPAPDDPIKNFKIKIWVMQFSENDPLNFPDTPESRDYFRDVINIANSLMGDIRLPLYGSTMPIGYPNDPSGSTHVADTRIRFSFDSNTDIEFVADPTGWSNDQNWWDPYLGNTYGVDDCTFDIFIIGDINSVSGVGWQHHNIHMAWWASLNDLNPGQAITDAQYPHAYSILHEFGHTLGLSHSWIGQFSDIQCRNCGDGSGSCAINCDNNYCDPRSDEYCLSNVMSYARGSKRNFTPLQIGWMNQWALRESHTRYLQHEYDPSQTITVSGQEEWATARLVNGDVIVPAGSVLTISCKVLMPPESRIIVNQGGRLIVDGGHLTVTNPTCGRYWQGILIEGDHRAVQSAANHGWVDLINGALVEYANIGVAVASGGILKMEDSEVKDCRYGVYLYVYNNEANPGTNLSDFSNSTFSVTNSHIHDIQPFLTMLGVSGISIYDCQFVDERDAATEFNGHFTNFLSRGIRSMNSNFVVSGRNTLFSRLWLGVEAGSNGATSNFIVREATFTDCFGGIVNRAVPYAAMVDNLFTMGLYNTTPITYESDDTPPIEWDGFGISVQNASGCRISDNRLSGFLSTGPNLYNTLGIYVNNLGEAANKIERNNFHDVTVSNYAEGLNEGINLGTGLQYLCNANTGELIGAAYDFYVQNDGRIASSQGSLTTSAGNTFRDGGLAPGYNFRNPLGFSAIEYYYFINDPTDPVELPAEVLNTSVIEASSGNGCEMTADPFTDPGAKEEYARLFEESRALYLQMTDDSGRGGVNFTATDISAAFNDFQHRGQRLLRSCMQMGGEASEEEIIYYLDALGDKAAHYALADWYRGKGNFVMAENVLNAIDLSNSASPFTDEYNDTWEMKNLHEGIVTAERSWTEMLPAEVAIVEEIALGGSGIPKASARQVLNSAYGYNYLKLPPLVAENNSALQQQPLTEDHTIHRNLNNTQQEQKEAKAIMISISPNPAKDNVRLNIEWPDNELVHYADLHILDTRGVEVFQTRILPGQTTYSWHPNENLEGVFYIYLDALGVLTIPKKVILIK